MLFRMIVATGSDHQTSEHRGVETTKNSTPLIQRLLARSGVQRDDEHQGFSRGEA
jgi:hypothetical protein